MTLTNRSNCASAGKLCDVSGMDIWLAGDTVISPSLPVGGRLANAQG